MRVAFLAALLACLQLAFGFVPAPMKPVTSRAAVRMSAAKEADFGGKAKAVLAGLAAPVVASAPVWATEGTGEAFGIDDGRIPVIMAVLGVAFASLFSTWSNAQNNEEFFSGYDKRRN